MKKTLIVFLALVSISVVQAQTTWKVDNAHSSITFSVSHYMISEITGNFGTFDIEAKTEAEFTKPNFTVAIDVATINTNQSSRDKHLQAADFFDVANHAKITFESTAFKQLEGKEFETKGTITIKGIIKEIVFKGKLNGIIKGRNGKQKAGLKLTSTINREDFKVGLGMNSIGKEVTILINVEMNEQ